MLNVIIPTYNSCEYLAGLYERNPFMADSRVNVWILDNASEDDTKSVCEQLVSTYQNLNYIRYADHVCAGDNVVRGLEINVPGYRWIFGDRYIFNGEIDAINQWMKRNEGNELLVISASNSTGLDMKETSFTDILRLIESQSAMLSLSCLSTAIYPPNFNVGKFDQSLYADSSFPHTSLILAAVNDGWVVKYTPKLSVRTLRGIKNWAYRPGWFNTGVVGWVDALERVSRKANKTFPRYTYCLFAENTSLGKYKGFIQRKLYGVLKFNEFVSNPVYLFRGFSVFSLFSMAVALLTPKFLIELVLSRRKKKNDQ